MKWRLVRHFFCLVVRYGLVSICKKGLGLDLMSGGGEGGGGGEWSGVRAGGRNQREDK